MSPNGILLFHLETEPFLQVKADSAWFAWRINLSLSNLVYAHYHVEKANMANV